MCANSWSNSDRPFGQRHNDDACKLKPPRADLQCVAPVSSGGKMRVSLTQSARELWPTSAPSWPNLVDFWPSLVYGGRIRSKVGGGGPRIDQSRPHSTHVLRLSASQAHDRAAGSCAQRRCWRPLAAMHTTARRPRPPGRRKVGPAAPATEVAGRPDRRSNEGIGRYARHAGVHGCQERRRRATPGGSRAKRA